MGKGKKQQNQNRDQEFLELAQQYSNRYQSYTHSLNKADALELKDLSQKIKTYRTEYLDLNVNFQRTQSEKTALQLLQETGTLKYSKNKFSMFPEFANQLYQTIKGVKSKLQIEPHAEEIQVTVVIPPKQELQTQMPKQEDIQHIQHIQQTIEFIHSILHQETFLEAGINNTSPIFTPTSNLSPRGLEEETRSNYSDQESMSHHSEDDNNNIQEVESVCTDDSWVHCQGNESLIVIPLGDETLKSDE